MVTHTCMAICKIYERCALSMDELHNSLCELFGDNVILKRVTDAKYGETAYEERNGFVEYMLKITRPKS